jgi:peptidoglycan-N-acetylglucosamine deacetylase
MRRTAFPILLAAALPVACTAQNAATPAPAAASTSPAAAAAPAAPAAPKIVYNACNVDGPYVAMTFDDGPHATNTPRLLDMLKQRGIKATFFVVGQCAQEYPQIMKRIVAEGHEVASHSWSHPNLQRMGEGGVREQLQRTHDIIKETAGVTPKVMRPPYGAYSPAQARLWHELWGYKVIIWDVDPYDWKYRNAARVHSEILRQTRSGSIILTHDIHKTTIDAMPETLDDLTAKGFKFVTVSDLLAMDKPGNRPPVRPAATPRPAAPDTGVTVTPAEPAPAAVSVQPASSSQSAVR